MNMNTRLTDKLSVPAPGSWSYSGPFDQAVKFIERHQLLDAELWARFAEQFTRPSDDHDLGWRCEYWGKLMRGGAMVWSYTRSPELYRQLEAAARTMLKNAEYDGRISTYSREAEFQGWDIWGRKYVLLGMEYFYDICADESLKGELLDSLRAQADCLLAHFGPGRSDLREASCHWEGLNSSSVLEPVVRLYNMTGERKYLDFAGYIVSLGGIQSANIFELASEDKLDPWQYPVTKAYEMMSCFEGLLEYARATGDERWSRAVVNFAHRVLNSDITIIGSAGCTHELFDHSRLRQADPEFTGIMQETCVTVTWMKLCGQVLRFTGDPVFGDAMERSLHNALLGAVNTRMVSRDPLSPGGWLPFDSYSPLRAGLRGQAVGGRMVMADNTIYGCCAAIGAAGFGAAAQHSAFLTEKGAAVSLYLPGTLSLQTPGGNRLEIRMDTKYPVGEDITLELSVDTSEKFELDLRIPGWCKVPEVWVNGGNVPAEPGWLKLERVWQDGDRVSLRLPMSVELISSSELGEGSEELPPYVALMRGPIALAASEEFPGDDLSGPVELGNIRQVRVSEAPFGARMVFEAELKSGGQMRFADYASVGKEYDKNIAVWLPCGGEKGTGIMNRADHLITQETAMQKQKHPIWGPSEYKYRLSAGFEPFIVSYIHSDSMTHPAILVTPGGAYGFVAPSEAEPVAIEFYRSGYNAFVLTYTVNPLILEPLLMQPLNDLSRAVRFVRKNASDFHIDPGKLAVCGFSAGGHLSASLCVHWQDVEDPGPEYAGISNRPDAAILSYPVITGGEYAHRGSFDALLGPDPDPERLHYMSLETQVTEKAPPCFLWQTAEDDCVPVENSYLFARACKAAGVRFAHHVFTSGQHGLSLANDAWLANDHGDTYTMAPTIALRDMLKSGGIEGVPEDALDWAFAPPGEPCPEYVKKLRQDCGIARVWPELAKAWLTAELGI